jgi:hypothetical protein
LVNKYRQHNGEHISRLNFEENIIHNHTFWNISIYSVGSINGGMLPVYDWLNLKFEKQWQDWMTGGERCGVEWYTV